MGWLTRIITGIVVILPNRSNHGEARTARSIGVERTSDPLRANRCGTWSTSSVFRGLHLFVAALVAFVAFSTLIALIPAARIASARAGSGPSRGPVYLPFVTNTSPSSSRPTTSPTTIGSPTPTSTPPTTSSPTATVTPTTASSPTATVTSMTTTSPTPTLTPPTNPCLKTTTNRARIAASNPTPSLNVVGQLGGTISNVVVQGNNAYVGLGTQLAILDVSNPAQPVLVGESSPLPGAIQQVAVAGPYAYATFIDGASGGFAVFGVLNPTSPTRVGWIYPWEPQPDLPAGLAVAGRYAYVISREGILYPVDVSSSANPVPLTTTGDFGFSGFNVSVNGASAYVGGNSPYFNVFTLAQPDFPKTLAEPSTPGTAWDVVASGSTVYVADGSSGLVIYDLSNPFTPRQLGAVPLAGSANTIALVNGLAYVTDDLGLTIVQVATPTNPVVVGCDQNLGATTSVTVAGADAYVVSTNGLYVVDVSDPAHPLEVANFRPPVGDAAAVVLSGTTALVADRGGALRLVDVSNPAAPKEIGDLSEPGAPVGVALEGNDAIVAAGTGGLRVVDVSLPNRPVEVGALVLPGHNLAAIAIAGTNAYVADAASGLLVVDLSSPSAPRLIGKLSLTDAPIGIAVANGYAYVVSSSKLHLIDVTTPTNPVEVGTLNVYPGSGVAVQGTTAYVTQTAGFLTYNVSNPAAPTQEGDYGSFSISTPIALTVNGSTLYLVGGPDVVDMVDVTNPAQPAEIALGWLPTLPSGIATANGYVYVADGPAGLVVLQLSSP